eukprot:2062857-Pleurochrysis_carterae.AAC.1
MLISDITRIVPLLRRLRPTQLSSVDVQTRSGMHASVLACIRARHRLDVQFTRTDASLCYVWSRMKTVNDGAAAARAKASQERDCPHLFGSTALECFCTLLFVEEREEAGQASLDSLNRV